ncbi:MAG TPA: tRNA pseudouridine(55) synthase TruB, partial [Anaerolineae bacterium]|nr:tRNA pseudouridine(55) synthase TruB [Anaerolineae bacterium]
MSGILNVDKPAGMTSHDVVAAVRRASGVRRVGHAGTLDPMATGVLVVCLGQATRVIEYLMDSPKTYRAEIVLGVATDTYDAEGRVTYQAPKVEVTRELLEAALSRFLGPIEQVPPMYSALKHEGKPLYELARQGIEVERKPRRVEIYRLEVISWDSPRLEIEVECSRGTYVRSLAHDLGEALGCGAHLRSLVRLRSGRFTLEMAEPLSVVEEAFRLGYWPEIIHPLDEALLDYEAMVVDRETAQRIRQGQQVRGGPPDSARLRRAYSLDGEFIGLLEYEDRTGLWQPRKVFAI